MPVRQCRQACSRLSRGLRFSASWSARGIFMKHVVAGLLGAAMVCGAATPPAAAGPTLEAVLGYPFQSGPVAAEHGGAVAWGRTGRRAPNGWPGRAPDYVPRQPPPDTP